MQTSIPSVRKAIQRLARFALRGRTRQALVVLGVAVLLVTVQWAVTGIHRGEPGYPVISIMSGSSMLHCSNGIAVPGPSCQAESWGHLGTLNPGDIIWYKAVHSRHDVETFAAGGRHHYGAPGDIVAYYRAGDRENTLLVHRALFWLHIHADGSLNVPDLGLYRVPGLTDEQLETMGVDPREGGGFIRHMQEECRGRSGLITRGDNHVYQDVPRFSGRDSTGEIVDPCPIPLSWVFGKMRGEIPWVGIVFVLMLSPDELDRMPRDLKVLGLATWLAILLLPFSIDLARHLRSRRAGHWPPKAHPRRRWRSPALAASLSLAILPLGLLYARKWWWAMLYVVGLVAWTVAFHITSQQGWLNIAAVAKTLMIAWLLGSIWFAVLAAREHNRGLATRARPVQDGTTPGEE